MRWILPSAVVALAAAVVLASWPDASRTLPKIAAGPVEFFLIEPQGRVTDARQFAWEVSTGPTAFKLEIQDASGKTVYAARVPDVTRYRLPDDARAKLATETDYAWQVSQINARGQVVESSYRTRFRISK